MVIRERKSGRYHRSHLEEETNCSWQRQGLHSSPKADPRHFANSVDLSVAQKLNRYRGPARRRLRKPQAHDIIKAIAR